MAFQEHILTWYADNKRELPWRKTKDPYRVLVAELMLQQTQVARVIPIYKAFLKQFPSFKALAKAELADVLVAWRGLGYNRRAKYLWQLSNLLPYGKLPTDKESLLTLPGIGHYTANAVLAFAYNSDDAAAVDTNIKKVFHRQFRNVDNAFIKKTVPKGKSRDWHNALMDFSSLVCTKKPQCQACPVRKTCKAYKEQDFSFAVPKQSTFKGSNRYYRGRVLNSLREGSTTKATLLKLGPKDRMVAVLASLEKEELVKRDKQRYVLGS